MQTDNYDSILKSTTFGIVGVSRNPKKFGNVLFREMKKKGLNVIPIHPEADEIENEKCIDSISESSIKIDALIVNISPEKTLPLVKEAEENGVKNFWFQQGSSNKEVTKYCDERNLNYVAGQCLLMYLEPVESIHKFHRFIWKLIGKYTK